MAEVFIIQNVSTNNIELKDFGLLLPADVSLDLQDYDESVLSSELDNYLESGDIIRLINGEPVSYEDAYLSTAPPLQNLSIDASIESLKNIHKDTKAPQGFVNKNLDSSIYVTDGIFYLTPSDSSIPIYTNGHKHFITDLSIAVNTGEGFHYIQIDSSTHKLKSTQEYSVDTFIQDAIPVAITYWDSTNLENTYVSSQRHGVSMSEDTQRWIADIFGISYDSGGILYDFSIGDVVVGVNDAEAQFSMTPLNVIDGDIEIEIDASTQALSPLTSYLYYISGPGLFRKDSSVSDILAKSFSGGSNRLAYAAFDPSLGFVQTEVNNDWFVNTHIIFINNYEYPVIALQGLAQYPTVQLAKDNAVNELVNLTGSGSLPTDEWKVIGTVIFQTSDTYSNTKKCRVVAPDSANNYINLLPYAILKTGGFPYHGLLKNLGEDDHKQYALLEGRSEDVLKIDHIIPYSLQGIDVSGYGIDNVGNPTSSTSAVNRLYVDSSLNVKANTSYVDSNFFKEASLGFGLYYQGGQIDVSVDTGSSFTAGTNIDISSNIISVVEDPSFISIITTDLSIGNNLKLDGNFLFDYGNTLTVAKTGAQYSVIQDAIDAADTNDIVFIYPGTYVEDISIGQTIALVGLDPTRTVIQGSTTINDVPGNLRIHSIEFSNTNEESLKIKNYSGSVLLTDCRLTSNWTTGAGQTATTAKSSLKLERGQTILYNSYIRTTASGDNTTGHNTTGIWVDGTDSVDLQVFNCNFLISNTLDPNQILSTIFNNATNSLTLISGHGGRSIMAGVTSGSNRIYPLYSKNSSAASIAWENGQFQISNTVQSTFIRAENSTTGHLSSGCAWQPIGVTSTITLGSTDASSTILFIGDVTSNPGPPITSGTVDYDVTMGDSINYNSGNIVLNENVTFRNYTNPDPSLGDFWMDGNELLFFDGNATTGLRSRGQNIGFGAGEIYSVKTDASLLFRTIDGSNGLYVYTDPSTIYIDSSMFVPGIYTATGLSYSGTIYDHLVLNYFTAQKIREKSGNNAAIVGNTGVTQLAPYDAPDSSQGLFYPWGTYVWNSASSSIEFNDWIIFFSDIQQNLLVNLTYDASALNTPDGAYGIYIKHTAGTPSIELVTELNRISYADKSYVGIIRVKDGIITNFGVSPDVYGVPRLERDENAYEDISYQGLSFTPDTSSTFAMSSGSFQFEGVNHTAWNFYTDSYTSSQHVFSRSAQNPVTWIETDPSTGIDDTISPYTDWRLYTNRYWDGSQFIDSSLNDKYLIVGIITARTTNQTIRGSVLYDSMAEAIAGIENFGANSQPVPNIFVKSFPLTAYIISRTNTTDISDENQVQVFVPAGGSASAGGGGGGGIVGASNLGAGYEVFSGTVNDILQFRTLTTDNSALLGISQSADTLAFSPFDFDPSISANKLAIEDLRSYTDGSLNLKVDKSGDIMTGALNVPDLNVSNDVSINSDLYMPNISLYTDDENILAIDSNGLIVDTGVPRSNISTQEIFDVNTNYDVSILKGIYYVDTTAGNLSVTIPDASLYNDGQQFRIIKSTSDLNTVTVVTSGATQFIGNQTTQVISQQDRGISIVADNDNQKWLIVQDSRFTEGNTEGDLQYWDATNVKWIPTSNLMWNASTNIFDVSGLIGVSEVSVGNKISFEQYTGTTNQSDLWVDSSNHLNFRYDISTNDASSYDLTNRLLRTPNDWQFIPEASILSPNDRILIEAGNDGYKKKWIDVNAFQLEITEAFGLYLANTNDLTTSSTTSTAFQNKLSLVTDASAPAGIYRVGWSLQISNSNNSKTSAYRVTVDGQIQVENDVYFNAGGVFWAFPGFAYVDVSAGSHTINIDYRALQSTASIKNTRLEWYSAAQLLTT